MSGRKFKKTEIEDFVKRVGENRPDGKWYQGGIELLPGVFTPSIDKTSDVRFIVKEMGLDKIRFKGLTVLDCGCNTGYYSCYAASKGAKRVLGFDASIKLVEASKELAEKLGVYNKVEFSHLRFEDINWETLGKFDVVLMNSFLYHIEMEPDKIISLIGGITDKMFIAYTQFWTKSNPGNNGLGYANPEKRYVKTIEETESDFRKVGFTKFKYFGENITQLAADSGIPKYMKLGMMASK